MRPAATLVILDVKVPLSDTQNTLETLLEYVGTMLLLCAPGGRTRVAPSPLTLLCGAIVRTQVAW